MRLRNVTDADLGDTATAVVQEWKERSQRLLHRLGFRRTGAHPAGDVTSVVEREAAA